MSPLTITARDAATGPVLEITGDLDHHTAPQLRQAVDALTLTGSRLLVLDLGGLDFCDSSGITALLAARNIAAERGADIALAAVPANPARILRIVGLDQVFTIHPDADAATVARGGTTSRQADSVP
ncbi:STAS domain-containing protein [Kitasatospora sp. NBC_01287]|uniref:STAS domain-containing protein n=1 Tax=Kitasatospora sp. NBC_01287 TaxID=2903573 RepID=UPI0022509D1D|nr:STAS domain-containing protein [Kitasatospora sp. NBC_01287]MCX4751030.1 STAS domain-containing protein [Kitasatospora sp. NBC_01287]